MQRKRPGGKRPPGSKSHRASKYSDPGARANVKTEEDLFAILDHLSEDPFLLVLDGIQDPHNLGACLRSADASGVHAVVAPKDRAVSITETVRTVARGAAESVPFVQVTNLTRTIKELQHEGIWFVGTDDETSQTLYDVELTGPLAIVVGSEGKGVRRLTADNCDFLVRIPMAG
ncbi:MAG: 23S rRNA (guanosine(2251)-2'-O)-methyltransferase RlmB, partial [candidate division Zixibacteria bacterium]